MYMKTKAKKMSVMDGMHEEMPMMEKPAKKGGKGHSALKNALLAKTLSRFRK